MRPADIISYLELCQAEGANLQRGMNYRFRGGTTVVLMSVRRGAPYADRVEEEGRTLIYEGHDAPKTKNGPDTKRIDQPLRNPNGTLTQNGLFFEAAKRFKNDGDVEPVRVYEKIRNGLWVYNGIFELRDAWVDESQKRKVFKFRLEISRRSDAGEGISADLAHNRLIPSQVKVEVWKRDKGRCVKCGSLDNLHFDHVLPFSRGGTSLLPGNIQLLCARHNLEKRDRIE